MNLYQKLVEIRKEVVKFEKDESSGSEKFGYKYVSGSQAIAKIRTKMDDLQILLVPQVKPLNHHTFNYTTSKGVEKTDQVILGDMSYVWINAENPEERLEIPWQIFGQQDDISKAFGSGLTYSERYFILKFFQAPTDDLDPDKQDGTEKLQGKKSLSEKQVNRLFAIAKSKGYNADSVKKAVLKKYNQATIENLTKTQYDEVCKGYESLVDKK